MSEFIKSLIDEAHVNLLNRNFDEAVRQLKSIKLRVNDDGFLGRMTKKENDIDQEYHLRYKNISANDDVEMLNKIMELKDWRTKEYLVFYDRISNEIP
jgi:hypothetical protein